MTVPVGESTLLGARIGDEVGTNARVGVGGGGDVDFALGTEVGVGLGVGLATTAEVFEVGVGVGLATKAGAVGAGVGVDIVAAAGASTTVSGAVVTTAADAAGAGAVGDFTGDSVCPQDHKATADTAAMASHMAFAPMKTPSMCLLRATILLCSGSNLQIRCIGTNGSSLYYTSERQVELSC